MTEFQKLNVGIVGGGPGCKAIMEIIFAERLSQLQMKLVGVASRDPEAVGVQYALGKGIYTTQDYRDLYELENLNMIIELTGNEEVANEIYRTKPEDVRVMDHVAARVFWDVFRIEEKRLAERREAEEAIRQSQEQYSTLVENSLTGIYIDQDDTLQFVNKRYAEIYGYSKEELAGLDTHALVHPDDRALTNGMRKKRLEGKPVPQEYEAKGVRKDGTAIWVARRNTRVEYRGKPAVLGNIVDITERKRAENELRESEERARTILDSIQAGIVIIDPETRTVVEANPVAAKMIGMEKEELIGKVCSQVFCFSGEHQCPIIDQGKTMDNAEKCLVTASGEKVPILKTVVPVVLGGRKHLLENFLDITDRKQAEEELRESQERYYTVLEACPDPVVVYDMEGRGAYINPAFSQVFGWTPGEILGMKMQYVPDENRTETQMMIDKVLAGESFSGVESCRYTKEGNVLDVSISAATYTNREGKPVGSVHILRDITDRKLFEVELQKAHDQLEQRVEERTLELARASEQLKLELAEHKRTGEALRHSEEQLRTINMELAGGLSEVFQALREIASGDPDVRIPETSELQSISRLKHVVNLTAKDLAEIVNLSHEFAMGLAEHFDVLHRVSEGDMSARVSGQSEVELLESLKEVTNNMIVHVTSELAERKDAERALRRVHRDLRGKAAALEAANEELSQYAYVVSHDLKAPLRAIRNYSDFLREDLQETLEPEQESYLDGLNRAVHQGEELVSDLLEFSRVGKRTGPVSEMDMKAFFKELTASLDINSDVELKLPTKWPVVHAARTLLRQVFQDLIRNAIKFNHSGKKRVEIGWKPDGDNRYEFYIRDNGIGIDPRYHAQIFDVFHRLHVRSEYDGTGLGLAIVKKAASKLQGSVRLESQQGEGSTFYVSIPKVMQET